MGRKSNFTKKQEILIEKLKGLKNIIHPRTYRSYDDDIRFNKTTVNQLTKIEKDLALIPSYGKRVTKPSIKNAHQRQNVEIASIMDSGIQYSNDIISSKLNKTSNKLDKYKSKFGGSYDGINFYFREYENNDFNKLNIVVDGLTYPNTSFIKPLVVNKLESLRKEISNKLQLHTYVTIKYKARKVEDGEEIDVERFLNISMDYEMRPVHPKKCKRREGKIANIKFDQFEVELIGAWRTKKSSLQKKDCDCEIFLQPSRKIQIWE